MFHTLFQMLEAFAIAAVVIATSLGFLAFHYGRALVETH